MIVDPSPEQNPAHRGQYHHQYHRGGTTMAAHHQHQQQQSVVYGSVHRQKQPLPPTLTGYVSSASVSASTRYLTYNPHQHQMLTHFNTISAAKLKLIHQQQQQHHHPHLTMQRQQNPSTKSSSSSSSPLNALFTWKRKSKTATNKDGGTSSMTSSSSRPAAANGFTNGFVNGHHSCFMPAAQNPYHSASNASANNSVSASASASAVPPSLARLFAHQQKHQQSVDSTSTLIQRCVCRGLTGSTFMVPTYYDEDDGELMAPKNHGDENCDAAATSSNKSSLNKRQDSANNNSGGGTIRSISNESLFDRNCQMKKHHHQHHHHHNHPPPEDYPQHHHNHNHHHHNHNNHHHHTSHNSSRSANNKRLLSIVKPFQTVSGGSGRSFISKSLERIGLMDNPSSATIRGPSCGHQAPLSLNRPSILDPCDINPYELVMDEDEHLDDAVEPPSDRLDDDDGHAHNLHHTHHHQLDPDGHRSLKRTRTKFKSTTIGKYSSSSSHQNHQQNGHHHHTHHQQHHHNHHHHHHHHHNNNRPKAQQIFNNNDHHVTGCCLECGDHQDDGDDRGDDDHQHSCNKNQSQKNSRLIVANLFNKANSVRIAGQTVLSAMANGRHDPTIELDEFRFATESLDIRFDPAKPRRTRILQTTTTIATTATTTATTLNNNKQHHPPPLQRSKSSGSLSSSSWSFDLSADLSSANNNNNHHSTKLNGNLQDEPEPDYDSDVQPDDIKPNPASNGCNNAHNNSANNTNRNRNSRLFLKKSFLNSIVRPKNIPPPPPPPPPPPSTTTTTTSSSALTPPSKSNGIHSAAAAAAAATAAPPPPPPPPPPPADFFANSTGKTDSKSLQNLARTTNSNNSNNKNQQPPPSSTSNSGYQNELKEKLNQGVKSILKKTNFQLNPTDPTSGLIHHQTDDQDSAASAQRSFSNTIRGGSVDRYQDSDTDTPGIGIGGGGGSGGIVHSSTLPHALKAKKHVHFRVKRNTINNCDSTSTLSSTSTIVPVTPTTSSSSSSPSPSSSLNRSRSASIGNIITETIHEQEEDGDDQEEGEDEDEDDDQQQQAGHNYYDDVSVPASVEKVVPLIGGGANNSGGGSALAGDDDNENVIFGHTAASRATFHNNQCNHHRPLMDNGTNNGRSVLDEIDIKSADHHHHHHHHQQLVANGTITSIDVDYDVRNHHHHGFKHSNVHAHHHPRLCRTGSAGGNNLRSLSFDELRILNGDDNANGSYPGPNGGGHKSTINHRSSLINLTSSSNDNHSTPTSSPSPPPVPARRSYQNSLKHNNVEHCDDHDHDDDRESGVAASAATPTVSNFLNRTLRSYSSGSVRSLLARKFNRSSTGSAKQQPTTSKDPSSRSSLSTMFQTPITQHRNQQQDLPLRDRVSHNNNQSSMISDVVDLDEVDDLDLDYHHRHHHHHQRQCSNDSNDSSMINGNGNGNGNPRRSLVDMVDEHIYEELDYCYLDSKMIRSSDLGTTGTTTITDHHHGTVDQREEDTTTTGGGGGGKRLFLGTRDEILEYLNSARQRLEDGHGVDQDDEMLLDFLAQNVAAHNSSSSASKSSGHRNNNHEDSGNSSLCLADDYQETLVCLMKKKALIQQQQHHQQPHPQQQDGSGNRSNSKQTTSIVSNIQSNRRNRISNISNASSESSNTSGVSVSNMTMDDIEDLDGITTSSSSLGSMINSTSSSSNYCYANGGTIGGSGSGTGIGSTTSTIERNDSGVGNELGGGAGGGSSSHCSTSSSSSSSSSSSTTPTATAKQQVQQKQLLDMNDMMMMETNKAKRQIFSCMDCEQKSERSIMVAMDGVDNVDDVDDNVDGDGDGGEPIKDGNNGQYYLAAYSYYVCQHCEKRRNERKEIISEIVDTELKYGRDLRIILEEFAKPISVAGLLTMQQVEDIFLNLDQLIEVNCHFAERLQDAFDVAIEQGDEDLTTVQIGQIFQECLLSQISVFERYCIRQASASLLLNQLEKEKELLRIFLRVSQMENALLRRMNLRSFLVVPVQRVTKYPLLLNRLQKVTPSHHPDSESLREAQMKLELHLDSINQKTKGSIAATTSRIWRRISNLSSTSMRIRGGGGNDPTVGMDDIGFVRLKKTSLELLKWPADETRFILIGKLSYIVEKPGTSSEQLNASYNSQSLMNLTGGHHHQQPASSSATTTTAAMHHFHSASSSSSSSSSSTTTTPSSSSMTTTNGSNSSGSKIWSRTLKFSSANAVLVVRSGGGGGFNLPPQPNSLSTSLNNNESDSIHDPTTPTSTLNHHAHHHHGLDVINTIGGGGGGDPSPVETLSMTDSLRFNSTARRRSNSKSPLRMALSLCQHQCASGMAANHRASRMDSREAMLILFKEKNGRYILCRDVLNLSMCVIANCTDFDNEEYFEIHELESRESLLLKAETTPESKEWLDQLRQQSQGLGQWRKRRNALPNIMVLRHINDMHQTTDTNGDSLLGGGDLLDPPPIKSMAHNY